MYLVGDGGEWQMGWSRGRPVGHHCFSNVTAALGLHEVHSNMYCAKETHLGDVSVVLDSLAAVWLAYEGLGDVSEQADMTSMHLSGQSRGHPVSPLSRDDVSVALRAASVM